MVAESCCKTPSKLCARSDHPSNINYAVIIYLKKYNCLRNVIFVFQGLCSSVRKIYKKFRAYCWYCWLRLGPFSAAWTWINIDILLHRTTIQTTPAEELGTFNLNALEPVFLFFYFTYREEKYMLVILLFYFSILISLRSF